MCASYVLRKLLLQISVLQSMDTIPKYTFAYAPMRCCRFVLMGDSSCVSYAAINVNLRF
jgi:hypothetical protein